MRKAKWSAIVLGIFFWVMPAPAQEGWQQLFNGRDLSGWEHVGPGTFLVEDGMLRTVGGMGLLWYTREKVGNAVLRVVYKTTHPEDNSGVYIRIADRPPDPWYAVHHGYEVQILDHVPAGLPNDLWHMSGAIYSISKAGEEAGKPVGEWNTLEITLDGPRTLVALNGKQVTDYTEGRPVPPRRRWFEPERGARPDSGYIGLQNHHANAEVYFKEVATKPLAR